MNIEKPMDKEPLKYKFEIHKNFKFVLLRLDEG